MNFFIFLEYCFRESLVKLIFFVNLVLKIGRKLEDIENLNNFCLFFFLLHKH